MKTYSKPLANNREKFYINYEFEGKTHSLSKKYYPDFWSKEQADNWIQNLRNIGEYDSIIARDRGESKLKSRKKNFNLTNLYALFEEYMKVQAPNSYRNSTSYLRNHVFYFFRDKIELEDVSLWQYHHGEFKDWLRREAKIKSGKRKLSLDSKNHCIKALNNLYMCLEYYSKMDTRHIKPISQFSSEGYSKGVKDLVDKEEAQNLLPRLKCSKDLYIIGRHTGMRLSELLGLSIADIKAIRTDENNNFINKNGEKTEIPLEPWVVDCIQKELNKKIYGYIKLESQADRYSPKRINGVVVRKPLKSRKKICPTNTRIIPIFEEQVWETIKNRYRPAKKSYDSNKTVIQTAKDYLLFNEGRNKLYRDFSKNCRVCFHSATRHSMITFTAGELLKSKSFYAHEFVKKITGITSKNAYKHYQHIHESYVEKVENCGPEDLDDL